MLSNDPLAVDGHPADDGRPWTGVRFSDEEYARRFARLQEALDRRGIDAAIVSDERTVWYLSGLGDATPTPSASRARPRIVLVPAAGPPTLFVQQCQHVVAVEMCWFDDVRAYPGLGSPIDDLVASLDALGASTLGLELTGELQPAMGVAEFDELRGRRPDLTICDVASAIWAVRMVKSPAELRRIQRACAITDDVYAQVFAALALGVTEREIARMVDASLRSCGGDDAWATVVSGEGQYDRVDGVPRDVPVPDGTMVFFDAGANVGGYWADFSRSGVFGTPSARQQELQEAIQEVTAAGVAAIRPGRTTGDVGHDIADAMAGAGLEFGSRSGRWGHGLGLIITEPPHVAEADDTVIEPGMVLTVEPNVIDRCGMFHCEENVVVTAAGAERLSLFPPELAEFGVDLGSGAPRHGS